MAKKVLVVDDEKLIVKGIRFSLEQDGMEVTCAYDGEEALMCAKEQNFDMILLDIMRRTSARGQIAKPESILESGDMRVDCESRRVSISGREVNLTAKEFDLLELLFRNPNKVYSREKLLNLVWGADYPGDVRTVDVHIRRLREKIETNPSEPRYVHTKWGVGYFFRV